MPSIIIQELTGSQRLVSLGGRALPERPLPAGSRLRSKRTWYAGSNVATMQVLGSEEMDMELRGVWNDRFIADQVITSGFETPELAIDVVRIFETLQRAGNALRFQWGQVVRMGMLAEFVPTWLREQDVEWSMRFDWFGRDDEEVPRATFDAPPNSAALRQRMNANDDQMAFEPRSLRTDYSLRFRGLASDMRARAGAIFDRIRAGQDSLGAIPLTSVRGLLADAEALRINGLAVGAELLDTPLEWVTDFEDVFNRLGAEVWRREQGRRALGVVAEGQRVARDMRRSTSPDPVAVVTARRGDSLRRIAHRHYGTADEWRRIADANGLPDSVVAPGALIVVPPLASPTATADEGSDCGGR